ncbi:putative phage protein [Xenorhabdus poinarii G6]|uniref:Putative phage protein n=1 Tax=Xenorhabdus poinarii G6 TaxID=1354304 RepID=A0A068R0M3_9GAMM|nr:phage tail protein [Xenorhabdus poinarii]CDG20471.1 putative phage protein [Xenorhabdus poinarii G6]
MELKAPLKDVVLDKIQTIRMILIVSSADSVTLKVDPFVILATREYLDDAIQKHANSCHHPKQ